MSSVRFLIIGRNNMRRFKEHDNIEIIPIEQDSDEWLEWRNQGIGSSDIALLMNPEPLFDRTVGSLWKQRVGYERAVKLNNDHIKRGKELEPLIRDKVNSLLKTDFKPQCIERVDTPYLRASLDGLDESINALLEIKAPSDSVFSKYLKSFPKIPENYYYQMQYQMLVSNVDYGLFAFYNGQTEILKDEKTGEEVEVQKYPLPYIIPVKSNHELQLDIERRSALFWGAVQNKIPIGWEDDTLQFYHIRPTIIVLVATEQQARKIAGMDLVLPVYNVISGNKNESFIKVLLNNKEFIALKQQFPEHRIEVISLVPSAFSVEVHETVEEDSLNELIMNLL
jgi:putative phage-type endonuclease